MCEPVLHIPFADTAEVHCLTHREVQRFSQNDEKDGDGVRQICQCVVVHTVFAIKFLRRRWNDDGHRGDHQQRAAGLVDHQVEALR